MTKDTGRAVSWGLSSSVVILAIIAWGQDNNWQISRLSPYQVFPLFGLLAFSIMWSHYIAFVIRRYFGHGRSHTAKYFEVTSLAVLFLIILHPLTLSFQLWRDGFGFPPNSYLNNYLDPSLRWIGVLGTLSLIIFLSYELRRFYNKKPWWKYFRYATDLAMIFIFYHSLRLGSQLRSGWFRKVWIFYGVTLVLALIYIYFTNKKSNIMNSRKGEIKMDGDMNAVDKVTMLLVIIGGINWGLVGLFQKDYVFDLLGETASRILYVIIGLSAVYALIKAVQMMSSMKSDK